MALSTRTIIEGSYVEEEIERKDDIASGQEITPKYTDKACIVTAWFDNAGSNPADVQLYSFKGALGAPGGGPAAPGRITIVGPLILPAGRTYALDFPGDVQVFHCHEQPLG
jgi:hypothetical protein